MGGSHSAGSGTSGALRVFLVCVYTLKILAHCLFVDLCRESQRQKLDCDSVFRLRTGLPQINTAHALLFKVLSD